LAEANERIGRQSRDVPQGFEGVAEGDILVALDARDERLSQAGEFGEMRLGDLMPLAPRA
jgi:hypothetical protein